MDGEGMVAVVRGLQGSGLAVTLLDSGRQFTLLPDNYSHPAPRTNGDGRRCYATASQCASDVARRESGVQATDGRYTSTYKMMHCHYTPTSPPDEVTEFPPQRPEICPGHGNFMIGGQGSGQSHCYPTKTSEYRGAMCWPDRGSVFSPRPSLQPDSFATSLRKYPNISQDRSSEIVERLINFTQAKNACKNRNASPTRNIESRMSNQTFCVGAESSRHTSVEKLKREYQPEVVIRPRRCEESPTREIFRQDSAEVEAMESYRRPTFCKTNDVRYLRDVSRKVRESMRNLSPPLDNRPERLSPRERYSSANDQRRTLPQWSTDTVNMEIQATVQVTTREIMTLPRIVPPQRSIAVPITPSISKTDEKLKEIELDKLTTSREESLHQIAQIIQTKLSLVDIQVQTTSSAIEFSGRKRHRKKPKIRSRSEERLQVIELLKYRRASGLKSRCYRTHNKDKRKEMFLDFFNKFESKIFNADVTDNRKHATERYLPTFTRIFRADVTQCKVVDDEALKEILRDWISLIPLKATNKFDAHKERKYIQYDFFNYLKRLANMPPEHVRKGKLKADILNRLKLVTLESKSDKSLIINRLADILIDKVNRIGRKRWDINISKNTNYETHYNSSKTKGPKLPRDKELEDFVLKYTTVILQNSNINIPELVVKDIEDELMDILMAYFKTEIIDYDIMESDIACMLYDYGISEEQAHRFLQIFVKKLKETLVNNTKTHKVRSKTLIILPNVCCHGVKKEPDTVQSITDEDIAANLKQYTNELCQQINEWLNDMRIQIPESLDKLKHEAINNLANDIVERHKYLELNPCNEINEEAEIENLKYQIFKWIKKLVAEDNLEPVQRAPVLNNRIKRIPIPVLTKLQGSCDKHPNRINNINTTAAKYDIVNEISKVMHDSEELGAKKQTQVGDAFSGTKNKDYEKSKGTFNDNSQMSDKRNMNRMPCTSACKSCCFNEVENLTVLNDCKDNDQLEAEYEQFVRNWVQKIPMKVADFEDEGILEKARMGIYNGLWKVVSKLNCDPATYFNRFLYEDLLDDAIDDLLDCLPQSSDLKSKRHLLKVEFIEKTISINDKIKDNEEASFKNKLIQNVITDLRKKGIADSQSQNSTKLHEDLQIIKLVEDYLLVTKFKNEDKIISEIYKNKLLKQVDDFVQDLKTNHANELKNIDVATYQTDLIAILDQVPLPSENTLNEEADDVLLNMEVEEWYQDLPIVSNNDNIELYQNRKQRDILVKKIKEVRSKNVMDGSENALRNEVSRFLEKTPLQEGESLNINFMVDELVNRLNNKTKNNNQSVSTKKVEFRPLDSYDQFSKDVPLCSSFIELPKSNNSLILQQDIIKKPLQGTQYDEQYSERKIFEQDTNATKIQIIDDNDLSRRRTRVVIQEPPSYRVFAEERPHSSSFKESSNDQWFSLLSSHPDVGTQTKNTSMYTISPYMNNETTQRNNEDNSEKKDISETLENSSFKIANNKQWLTLQRSHPDVGTQTSDINMYKQSPCITDNISAATTKTNAQKNIGFKDIPKCCQQSHYSFHRDKEEYKHIDDASPIARSPYNQATSQTLTETQHTQHTQPSHVSDSIGAATTRTNAQNKIELEDIPKCWQKSDYYFPHEDKNSKINASPIAINPNNQGTSQTLTNRKTYQLNDKEKPYIKDISEIGEDDKQIFIKEEDVSSLKCSIECQADNETKYGNQVLQHTLQDEIKKDRLKVITPIVDKAKFKVPSGTKNQTPLLLNEQRSRDMQENEVTGKLDYDSAEEDIPCRCIERYMNKMQKRYPCEAFDRLPYLPIFYPYPYFI